MDEINTGGSSAVKSSRPANMYQNARVPPVVVESVASFISDTMVGHFFEELATRNPRHHSVLPNSHRTDLLSMCLVHRTWTPIMQRILRRRVRIHSPLRLKGFLESPTCGPWVVELWYIYDKVSSDFMDLSLFVIGEKRSHCNYLPSSFPAFELAFPLSGVERLPRAILRFRGKRRGTGQQLRR